ncbi:SDR family NAD(P)-dependent oxidoreductase [Salaquimonas pukyongi]|uniref:SDR family NAD(P)-dependent oxidoreductase n=1 Tax=Salaquimonas pukyongi TaxID=2712698 RepID=UPI00096BA4F5|nr:glucose 1-dehydrogenase [Salaquimonas pukyongi]
MTQYDFTSKTVLVSGAGGGIGLAAAKRFADAGANLVLTDRTDETLHPAKTALQQKYPCIFLSGDVTRETLHLELAAAAIETFGRLDIALNNAGIVQSQQRLEDISADDARKVLEVDVMAVLHAMKAQLPIMREQFEKTGDGGVILNTASVAGLVGAPTLSVYGAAKHAVIGLTRAAAIEYARKGIRINAICPAFTRTAMLEIPLSESPHGRETAKKKLISNIPMARVGEVDEIVQAMLWVCSPENSFYTGQALALDGGLSAG